VNIARQSSRIYRGAENFANVLRSKIRKYIAEQNPQNTAAQSPQIAEMELRGAIRRGNITSLRKRNKVKEN
jgi:hypothetical protein